MQIFVMFSVIAFLFYMSIHRSIVRHFHQPIYYRFVLMLVIVLHLFLVFFSL